MIIQIFCDLCSRAFTETLILVGHKRIDTCFKPFLHDVRGKASAWAVTLMVRKRIHTGHESDVCDVCSKRFTTTDALKMHREGPHW